MSTHAYIAEKVDEINARVIYCHADGYPKWTGDLLLRCYNTPDKVTELIDLGDISVLKEKLNPDPSKPHGFDYDMRQPDVTVAYGRDRGETGIQAKNCKMFELEELENPYLFDGNKWLYYIDNKWIPLCTVLSQIKNV